MAISGRQGLFFPLFKSLDPPRRGLKCPQGSGPLVHIPGGVEKVEKSQWSTHLEPGEAPKVPPKSPKLAGFRWFFPLFKPLDPPRRGLKCPQGSRPLVHIPGGWKKLKKVSGQPI